MRVIADEKLGYGWFVHSFDPPALSMVVVVKATFTLKGRWMEFADGPGPMTRGDRYEIEGDLNSPLRYPSDLVPWKQNADFIVIGSAYAPGGEPVKMLTIEASIGSTSKKLAVFGDRTWVRVDDSVGVPSEPQAFTKMPIGSDRAYGGPGFDLNPVGRGHGTMSLPNIEDPLRTIATSDDRAAPAGFGPVALTLAPRTMMNGTYDDSYVKTRWPWLAADTDWRVFNAAPLDQQIDGYLYGGESIHLVNLLPGKPDFRTHLPLLRVRCPLGYTFKDGRTETHDPRMVLDTVVVDTDAQIVTLVWRGRVPAPSIKLLELDWIFPTCESLLDAPRTLEELRAEFDRRVQEAALPPIEIRENLAEADAKTAEAVAQAEKAKADALAQREARLKQAPEKEAVDAKEPEDPPSPFLTAIAQLQEKLAALKARGLPDNDPEVAELGRSINELKWLDAICTPQMAKMSRERVIRSLARKESLADRNLASLDLSGLDFSGADLQRAVLSDARCVGANFAGANLTDMVSSGGDFSQADFSGACLDKAIFFKCTMPDAVFAGASGVEAIMTGLDLKGINFRGMKARGVNFFESDLSDTDFSNASVPEANFCFTQAHRAIFTDADLTDADFTKAKAQHLVMTGARGVGIRFSHGADIRYSSFSGLRAMRSNWKNALATGCDFTDADLMDSILGEGDFDHCLFRRTNLTGADLADSDLSRTLFEDGIAARALFDRCNVTETQFRRMNAVSAGFWMVDAAPAVFESSNLRKTVLA